MEYEVIVFNEAREDIIEITKWYDLKSLNLSNRFINELDEAINKLIKNPEAYPLLFGNVRKIRLKKFPYIIFYKFINRTIKVYGIIHVKRNPSTYKKRLKNLGK